MSLSAFHVETWLWVLLATLSCEFPKTPSQLDAVEISHIFLFLIISFLERGFGLEESSCAYFWVASNRRFSQTQAPRCSDEFPVFVRVPFHSVGFPLCMQGFAIQGKVRHRYL